MDHSFSVRYRHLAVRHGDQSACMGTTHCLPAGPAGKEISIKHFMLISVFQRKKSIGLELIWQTVTIGINVFEQIRTLTTVKDIVSSSDHSFDQQAPSQFSRFLILLDRLASEIFF